MSESLVFNNYRLSNDKSWIALFSQTGSELIYICQRLQIQPDLVATNNDNYDLFSTPFAPIVVESSKDIFERLRQIKNPEDYIITLHGFLRIIPPDICEKFEIYNGHPGDIVTYGDLLKGKDPQQKAWDLKHKTARAVIHRVTPVVDDGEVVAMTPLIPITETLTDVNVLINLLKADSVQAWVRLLKEKLN